MTVIRIKICRQTGPYGRVPQNRFWFAPSLGQGIVPYLFFQRPSGKAHYHFHSINPGTIFNPVTKCCYSPKCVLICRWVHQHFGENWEINCHGKREPIIGFPDELV